MRFELVCIADSVLPSDPSRSQAEMATVRGSRASLYALHCASCHGANLEGQPNGRTPAIGAAPGAAARRLGHTWHHPDERAFPHHQGGRGGGRARLRKRHAGLRRVCSRTDEIRGVLAFLKSTWPERERAFPGRAAGGQIEGGR